jgi:DNA-binding response OmpR family regulator
MTGLRVLIVEDNVDAADSLAEFLRFCGFDVRIARTGPDGVAAALSDPPEAMLCDINLPGFDGFEVANRVREALPRPPVFIAVTAWDEGDLVARAGAAGFDYYFCKPANPTEVAGLLSDYAVERPGAKSCA